MTNAEHPERSALWRSGRASGPPLPLLSAHPAPQNSYRGLWKREDCLLPPCNLGCRRRSIRIGVAILPIVFPRILCAAEGDEVNIAGKRESFFVGGILKNHPHSMRTVLVAVDHQKSPVPIGPM